MKVNEYLPNLDAKSRFDLIHWNASIGPDKWPIFGRFLTLFALKHPARREKTYLQYGGRTLMMSSGDVTASPLQDQNI
jgi:hypothetical protein